MNELTTRPNISDPDGFYAELIAIHDGLGDDESQALNARLVLIFANHIGNRMVLSQALDLARDPKAASTASANVPIEGDRT